jgi:hypothetical protein
MKPFCWMLGNTLFQFIVEPAHNLAIGGLDPPTQLPSVLKL